MIEIQVKKLNPQAVLPKRMSEYAAGSDVCACLEAALEIGPGERLAVPTGLAFQIPNGFEVQVRPRSGLAIQKGLTVVNAPGTIDSDYRGEVKILLINLSKDPVCIEPGMRIAQLIVQKVESPQWNEVESLGSTSREAGGFGSTGV